MSLRRIRQLAGLNESITDDPALNSEIERRLDALPSDIRTPVLDALDVLYNAGHPLTLQDWAETIRQINGDPDMPMKDVLKTTVTQFPICVSKTAPGTYEWKVVQSSDSEDIDPQTAMALHSHVGITQAALQVMRHLGSFTVDELKAALSRAIHAPPQVVDEFVNHLMTTFGSMLDQQGNRYTLKIDPIQTRDMTMQNLRNLANRPGQPPDTNY
jgi:hypothetical protein